MALFGAFVKETCTVSGDTITLTGRYASEYLTFDEEFSYDTALSYALVNEEGTWYSLGVGYFDDATTITRRDVWRYEGVFAVADISNETVPSGTYFIVSTPHQYSTNELIRPQNIGIADLDADDFTFFSSTFRNEITLSGTGPSIEFGDITADMLEPLFSGQKVSFYTNNNTANFQVITTGGLGVFGGDVGGLGPTSAPPVFQGTVLPGVGYFWRRIDTTSQSQADWNTGESTIESPISPLKLETKVKDMFNVSGDAPMFACRAWANFSGTTNSINASGNISSITSNGAGDKTLNFTVAMEDAFYCYQTTAGGPVTEEAATNSTGAYTVAAGSIRVRNRVSGGALANAVMQSVAIFR